MRDLTRLVVVAGVFFLGLTGWALAGHVGAAVGSGIGMVTLVVPWRGCSMWSWIARYARRNRPFVLAEPLTIVNDRVGGGVRCQGGIAAVAVQLFGKPYQPTYFTGSVATETENSFDIRVLIPVLRQSLGLNLDSISILSAGARRRGDGDYPRVYDTLVGTPPYAGQRETWLIMRIRAVDNGEALQCRPSLGTAAVAAAQRTAAMLRRRGFRARVASAADLVAFERRIGNLALEPRNRHWRSVRSDAGWQTSYAYRPEDIDTESLAQGWTIPADGVIQNLTLHGDATISATITLRTAQPPSAPPSVALQALPGQQAQAMAANMCGPRPELGGVRRTRLSRPLVVPIGPSGVLVGRTPAGDRLALPLAESGEQSRVHIAADDAIIKRLVIRIAAAGDRVTVHSADLDRWESVRMPHIAVIEHPRPSSGTTVSVTDGTVVPAPRPHTVISVGPRGSVVNSSADVLVRQTGPATVEVTAAGIRYEVDVDLFRAENRYASDKRSGLAERAVRDRQLEMAD